MTLVDKSKEKSAKKSVSGSTMKRPTRKKPKDKPKRPLSAYNYFFKQERQRILKWLARDQSEETNEDEDQDEDNSNSNSNSNSNAVVDAEQEKRLVTEAGKVSFEEMGKLIGRRWKSITSENLEKYSSLAATDAERYKKEIAEYNEKKEKGAMMMEANSHAAYARSNNEYAAYHHSQQVPPSAYAMPPQSYGSYNPHASMQGVHPHYSMQGHAVPPPPPPMPPMQGYGNHNPYGAPPHSQYGMDYTTQSPPNAHNHPYGQGPPPPNPRDSYNPRGSSAIPQNSNTAASSSSSSSRNNRYNSNNSSNVDPYSSDYMSQPDPTPNPTSSPTYMQTYYPQNYAQQQGGPPPPPQQQQQPPPYGSANGSASHPGHAPPDSHPVANSGHPRWN